MFCIAFALALLVDAQKEYRTNCDFGKVKEVCKPDGVKNVPSDVENFIARKIGTMTTGCRTLIDLCVMSSSKHAKNNKQLFYFALN